MSFLLPHPNAILSQHKLVENDECVDTYQGHYIVEQWVSTKDWDLAFLAGRVE